MCLQVDENVANVFLSMHSQVTSCPGIAISKAVAVIDTDFGCYNRDWVSGNHIRFVIKIVSLVWRKLAL